MALKAFYSKKEDIPEKFAELYKQQSDGTWKLDADGIEDVSGLKSALEKERDERRAAKLALSDLQKKIGEADIDEALNLLADKNKGKLAKLTPEEYEATVETEVGKRVTKLKTDLEAERDDWKGKSEKSSKLLSEALVDTGLRTAATNAGVLPEAITDAVARGLKVFALGDEGAVLAKKPNGDVIYGSDGKTSMTPGEYMEGLKSEAGFLFGKSKGGGAGRKVEIGGADQHKELNGVSRMRAAHSA